MQYSTTPRTLAGLKPYLRSLALVPALAALGVAGPIVLPAGAAVPVHHAAKACSGPNDVTLDFVAADINDVLKALSMQSHINIVSGADVKGTVTVSLAHVTLEDALDLVTRLSGFQYAKVGRTYVVGSPTTINNMAAAGMAAVPTQTAVISYLYSDPDSVSSIVKQLIPNIQISAGKTSTTGTGGVFIVTGTEAQLAQVKQIVGQSEAGLSKNIASSQTVVYNIKYGYYEDLVTALAKLVPTLVVSLGPNRSFALDMPIDANVPPTTHSGSDSGKDLMTAKRTYFTLLLTGSVEDIARGRQLLEQIDARPAQIRYEAKVTEINLNKAQNLGLTYNFSGAVTQIGEVLGNKPDNTPRTSSSDPYGDPYAGNILKGKVFVRSPLTNFVTVGLNALFNSGDAKLLSNPNISAVDGQQAGAFIGDTIRYVSSITQTPTGQNVTIDSVNVGIKLYVTGKVNNDGYVTLNIHPEVSTITDFLAVPGGGKLPQVSTREATTTVRVKDGDTIAIGGLISESDIKNVQKVPFLGDLPFFGNFFRNTNHQHNRDEVVIFLKVSIDKETP